MNINKLSPLVSCALLALLSCSKNDPVVVNSCLLTKMTTTVMSGTQVSTTITDVFEYDADRRLARITEANTSGSSSSNLVQTYSYSSGMVASVKTDGTVSGTSVSVLTTWTNDKGHVVKVAGPNGLLSTFTYDGAGNLQAFNNTDVNGLQTTLTATYSTDLVSVKAASPGINIDVTYGPHDAKINPFTLLAKAINQPYFVAGTGLINAQYLHKANPLSEKDVLTFAGVSNTLNVNYVYEYNTRGYPTKTTQQIPGSTQSGVVSYEYKDCN